MVAPSYQKYETSGEPFVKNKKKYIEIIKPNGTRATVRWYSEIEYQTQYGTSAATKAEHKLEGSFRQCPKLGTDRYGGLKAARGFSKGPILVIRGALPRDETWLCKSQARYAVDVGWFFCSTDILPDDAPANFKYLLLYWEEFAVDPDDITKIKSIEDIQKILKEKERNGEWVRFNAPK